MRFRDCLLVLLAAALVPCLSAAQSGDESPALQFAINAPSDLALDHAGHLYVAEGEGARVLRIDLRQGTISVVAGNGKDCCFREGARAVDVSLDCLCSLAVDSANNLYIGDSNGYVRKVDPQAGFITTVAGAGEFGTTTEGAAALEWRFSEISGLAVNSSGDLFISDIPEFFKVDAKTRAVTRLAGTPKGGYSGDGGPALNAAFSPFGAIALDGAGNLLIGDFNNCRIRRVDRGTGIVRTIVMTGTPRPNGTCLEDTYGNSRPGPFPSDPAPDSMGNVYFEEGALDVVGRVDARTHAMTFVAGNGDRGFSGDGGPATEAEFDSPSGLAIDADGNLYISDWGNNRVRRVDAKTGIIMTIAGNGLPPRTESYE